MKFIFLFCIHTLVLSNVLFISVSAKSANAELKTSWAQYPNAFLPNNVGSPAYPGNVASYANAPNLLANNLSPLAGAPLTNVPNPVLNNIQVTPMISEIVPSLQFGEINMSGDMPIGGTIKVRGCFPVYGVVGVDGIVPSLGSAIVTEVIGNQVLNVVNKCANQLLS